MVFGFSFGLAVSYLQKFWKDESDEIWLDESSNKWEEQ